MSIFLRKNMKIIILIGIWVFAMYGCSSREILTRAEKEKLDYHLQRLMTGEVVADNLYNVYTDESGNKRYGVVIIASDPDALSRNGIPTNSVRGQIITAKLTVDEIRRALNIPGVKSIQNTSKNFPQQ